MSGAIMVALASSGRAHRDIDQDAAHSDGEWIFPEGGSSDLNNYVGADGTVPVQTNGINGNRTQFVRDVNASGVPGYFNPSHGLFADLWQSIQQKFFAAGGDPLAAGFSSGVRGVRHPLTIVAHSQGTLTVSNAAVLYGLPTGSVFELRSPAIGYFRAYSAARLNGGTLRYLQPWGDIANLYSPTLNPIKWASGFRDLVCGMCTHQANGL